MFEFFSSLILFFLGMKTLIFNKKHLLMMLLSLEMLSLVMITIILLGMSIFSYDYVLVIYMMIVLVCEAVTGLVLLTLLVRSHGSDYMKSSSMLLC